MYSPASEKKQSKSYTYTLAMKEAMKEATYVSEAELGSMPLPLLSDYMIPKPDCLYLN